MTTIHIYHGQGPTSQNGGAPEYAPQRSSYGAGYLQGAPPRQRPYYSQGVDPGPRGGMHHSGQHPGYGYQPNDSQNSQQIGPDSSYQGSRDGYYDSTGNWRHHDQGNAGEYGHDQDDWGGQDDQESTWPDDSHGDQPYDEQMYNGEEEHENYYGDEEPGHHQYSEQGFDRGPDGSYDQGDYGSAGQAHDYQQHQMGRDHYDDYQHSGQTGQEDDNYYPQHDYDGREAMNHYGQDQDMGYHHTGDQYQANPWDTY